MHLEADIAQVDVFHVRAYLEGGEVAANGIAVEILGKRVDRAVKVDVEILEPDVLARAGSAALRRSPHDVRRRLEIHLVG